MATLADAKESSKVQQDLCIASAVTLIKVVTLGEVPI